MAEYLRSLGKHQAFARDGRAYFRARRLRPADLLDRVDRNDAHDGGAVLAGFVKGLFDDFEIDERPHGVMNSHQIGIGAHGGEAPLDRFLPAVAALDHAHGLVADLRAQQRADRFEILAP